MTFYDRNFKWIYTYDYAPDSVWEPWREREGVPSWIFEEADAVVKRIEAIKEGTDTDDLLTFALLADSHYAYNGTWDDTAYSLKAIAERISLDGVIHLGDLTDGLLPLTETQKLEKRCLDDMKSLGTPLYVVPGNHDYNYFRGNPEISYPDRPRFLIDYDSQKLRLIFLDSFDPRESVRYGFTEECIRYLDDTLNSMPAGYVAVIFAHVTPLVQLQSWAKEIRNSKAMMTVLETHSSRILAYIDGHSHCDHIYNSQGGIDFPMISLNCAKCEFYLDHKPDGAVVPGRKLGDRTQECFDIMQIDVTHRKIFFTRFGAGYDRIVVDGMGRYIKPHKVRKVITYGIRFEDYGIQMDLFALRNNGDIDIVAELGYTASDREIFFCRQDFEDGISLDHDLIIVQERDREALLGELSARGLWHEQSLVNDITYLTIPHFDEMEQRQLMVLKELVEAPYEQILDREWLRDRLYSYGFNPFFKLAKDPEQGVTWTTHGVLQVPEEFLDFCLYLVDERWRNQISRAIEIGVWRGSSSYILAALLYRNNPGMSYSMVDISDGLIHFDDARKVIPNLKKCIPSTSDDYRGETYDFCFIDADHSYDGMMNDYMNVGRYTTGILAFHDIYGHEYDHLNGGTVRGWQEIKKFEDKNSIIEFTKYPDFWMGIGVVEKS